MSKLVVIALLAAVAFTYPLFKQCDSQWGSDALGNSGGKTVCQSGCTISSISMVLNDCGKTLDGSAANPGTFNTWLKSHSGFSGNLFVWGSIATFGFSYQGKVTGSDIDSHFNQGHAVILNVNNGGHWVLMTGISGDNYSVNDPGYSKTSYPKTGVTQAAVYTKPSGCWSLSETVDSQFIQDETITVNGADEHLFFQ